MQIQQQFSFVTVKIYNSKKERLFLRGR